MTTVVLLLAAGASSRMGQPKMFLTWKGETLLQHAISAAASVSTPVFVVTGEHTATVATALEGKAVQLIRNDLWQKGMGTSVAAGVAGIAGAGYIPDAVIIVVCDQPFITAGLLEEMIAVKESSGKGIVACSYDNTTGTPVLFDKKYFPALQQLNGQQGAKRLLQQFSDDLATVSFPAGNIDIDTPEDYERLKNLDR